MYLFWEMCSEFYKFLLQLRAENYKILRSFFLHPYFVKHLMVFCSELVQILISFTWLVQS